MPQQVRREHDLSARRIVGFACNQAFLFSLFYLAPGGVGEVGGFALKRADLLFTLLFMVVGFSLVLALGKARVSALFARPLLYVYAIVAAAGSLLPVLLAGSGVPGMMATGLFTGVPSAFLLTAWGRSFGGASRANSVPEVFLGSLVAALLMGVFFLLQSSPAVVFAVRLLPLASVVNIEFEARRGAQGPLGGKTASGEGSTERLSAKMLAGTLLLGMAAGVVELNLAPAASGASYLVSMAVFGAYLIGGLSLLLSDGFDRGAALGKSYRLAVFVMLAGVLLVPVPVLSSSILPGQAVMLAGYLGLEVVLVSLFVVMGDITGTDCALSFSSGFSALFAGEVVGVLLSNAFAGAIAQDSGFAQLAVALAGALALASFVFLFTDRDLDALSQIVSKSDSVERACGLIVERYGLSRREAEILGYALRGRTSERIAQELVIAKSTVDTHLRRIYAKCGVRSRQELIDLAEKSLDS